MRLLRNEPKEAAGVGGRERELLLQVGEIERGQIGQRRPIVRAQI